MSNTKHTPGPWQIIEYPDSSFLGVTSKGEYADVCQIPADGNRIPERKANAKLIAAAPELLEALTSLYSKFKNEGLGKDKWYGEIMERAKAAIKKATE